MPRSSVSFRPLSSASSHVPLRRLLAGRAPLALTALAVALPLLVVGTGCGSSDDEGDAVSDGTSGAGGATHQGGAAGSSSFGDGSRGGDGSDGEGGGAAGTNGGSAGEAGDGSAGTAGAAEGGSGEGGAAGQGGAAGKGGSGGSGGSGEGAGGGASTKAMKFLVSGDTLGYPDWITPDGTATWLATDSWQHLADGDWLGANTSLQNYRQAHPGATYDFGTPLAVDGDFAGTASGAHDDDFRNGVGNWAAAGFSGTTVYSRLQWEFNLGGAPNAADFTAAWKHIVPVMREAAEGKGIDLKIVWCPNAASPLPEAFYPGDDVVDVIAADVYAQHWGTVNPSPQQVVDDINTYLGAIEQMAAQHHKPQALGEFANTSNTQANKYGCGDCAEPVTQGYQPWEKRGRGTDHAVEYVSYFNLADGGVGETLDALPNTRAALKTWVNDARKNGN